MKNIKSFLFEYWLILIWSLFIFTLLSGGYFLHKNNVKNEELKEEYISTHNCVVVGFTVNDFRIFKCANDENLYTVNTFPRGV
jgi:hypothetical protein